MKNYLRYICASFLTLMSGMMAAQNMECIDVEASYSIDLSGGTSKVTGTASVTFQGHAFHMVGNGIEVFCDGADIWTIDTKAKEVYVEQVTSEYEEYMNDAAPRLASMQAGSEASFDLPEGMKVHLNIKSIKKAAGKEISSFRPQYDFDSSWAVVDLR